MNIIKMDVSLEELLLIVGIGQLETGITFTQNSVQPLKSNWFFLVVRNDYLCPLINVINHFTLLKNMQSHFWINHFSIFHLQSRMFFTEMSWII